MTECWSSCNSFLRNQKSSEADSFRVSSYAAKIAEALGLDPESTEDLRTAALLRNVNEIGISNEILYKAANLSQEELEKGMRKGRTDGATRAQLMGGSLRRAIPILVAAQQLHVTGASPADSIVEVQILNLAEKFDVAGQRSGRRKDDFRSGRRKDHERLRRQIRFDDCRRLCESFRTESPGSGAVDWLSQVRRCASVRFASCSPRNPFHISTTRDFNSAVSFS